MKPGRPKKDASTPARGSTTKGHASDVTLGARHRTTNGNQPRQTPRGSLVTAMLRHPGLTDDDRESIRSAIDEAPSLGELRAAIALRLALVQRFLESGELAAKDCIVALDKISSSISVAVQLGAATSAASPSEIRITWGDGHRPSAPPVEGRAARVSDPVAGDLVDAD